MTGSNPAKSQGTIDATYGRGNDTYTLPASCLNCGWTGEVRRTRGYRVIGTRFTCPKCGCNEVRAIIQEGAAWS